MNLRNADHRDLKLAMTLPERRLRRDYRCINSLCVSTVDGDTRITATAQCRHHVMMIVTSVDDKDSRNLKCSTWQLCTCISLFVDWRKSGCWLIDLFRILLMLV